MSIRNHLCVCLLMWLCVTIAATAAPESPSSAETSHFASGGIEIDQVEVRGRIDGPHLAVTLAFEAQSSEAPRTMTLIQGDAVLEKLEPPLRDVRLDYDPNDHAYRITWPRKGSYPVRATFMAASSTEANSVWRRARLEVPAGRVRRIRLVSRQSDVEIELPGALQVQRRVEGGELVVEALLGPREPLVVRWKPQVQLAGAELVFSSQANTIVDVRAGLMQVDALFDFQVAQGRIESLTLKVPAGLSIVAVQGPAIRAWGLGDEVGGTRALRVELSRPQERDYRLRIRAEAALNALPSTVDVPAIEPTGGIRASGQLAVGTNSALQLVVQESSGLTQIDAAAFPRVAQPPSSGITPDTQSRPIPQGKAFFYTYAGSRYRLRLMADDIVPAYDVVGRLVARIKEDDLLLDAELELDVRDAPVGQLEITTPAGFVVAAVDGNRVDDYHLPNGTAPGQPTTVRVVFTEPVIGRTLLHLRLELGRGPLGVTQSITSPNVVGAKTQRGYVVVATETGIEIDPPQIQNLREVHTASVPLRVPQAQYAYRFREADWTMNLMSRRRPAEVRAEVFHLQSIGETLAHGSAVVNYLITGSPLDELRFRLPDSFENVEFVGSDVRRWVREGDVWVVRLTRKVLGDYNLAVTHTQRHASDRPIQLGALRCPDVQTQTGYVVVTSHLDLRLELASDQTAGQAGLLPISLDELPGDYRLLTSSPILAAYKYVSEPHTAALTIDPYRRSGLLPVAIDIADLQTRLAIRPDGRIESATIVRYKVKNTTGQFLALTIPAETRVWAVSSIETAPDGSERSSRLAASREQGNGRLLVPLRRQTNPNDPLTIELEYGQVHDGSGRWRPRVNLAAPGCTVPIVYADWRVTVPSRWTIDPTGGNMQAQAQPQGRLGLAPLARQIGQLWSNGARHWWRQPAVWLAAAVAGVLFIVVALFRRAWLPETVLFIVLVYIVWIGIEAGADRLDVPKPPTSLSFTQAVSVDPAEALQVEAALVPAWRRSITIGDIIGAAVVIVAAVALVFVRRYWWKVGAAGVVAVVIYVTAKVPPAWPVLKALATWFVPAVLAAWFVYRLWRRQAMPARAVAVAMILLLMCAGGGCAGSGAAPQTALGRPTIERLECALRAGADSMEIKYSLRVSADRPSSFPLLDESAVLVSPADLAAHAELRVDAGRHVVRVDRSGTYDLEATFLAPLLPAGPEQRRHFELALPAALTNRISLAVPDANVVVEAPRAVLLTRAEQEGQTHVEAMFVPGEPATFAWRPRERQTAQEEVRFYAQDLALASVTPGLLQVFHAVRLQIAQGQVDRLTLDVPQGQTVTSVNGPGVGAWRYDPASHTLEVRLSPPVTGSYALSLVTQSANASVPYQVRLQPLVVQRALDQHSVVGLAAEPSVYVQLDEHPAAMNVRDYVREVGDLVGTAVNLRAEQISQAFRFDASNNIVTGRVQAVQSEVRSQESARFNVEDERLVYNSQWDIEIAKAGRFDIDLLVPEGFDIDALEGQMVSHWDDSTDPNQRRVRVHFQHKLIGPVRLRLALSRAIAEIPARLSPPRVMVAGAIKHTGYLLIGAEQGVRVSVASRQGVSEVNPAELGQSGPGFLAFQFLRPDWQLELQTELMQARVTVQGLHIARVTDGLVRHQQALRYRLYHAGAKAFTLTLPPEAVGVTITGPGIARREQAQAGRWQVELADKVYDRPYLLNVAYETRYDPADGNVPLVPVRCEDADLQHGHVAVFATDRVELAAGSMDASFRPADARTIPDYFGAGDLSGAAMCYRSVSAQYSLIVRARRHAAAEQIGAEVLKTDLTSVVTGAGQAINRVALLLRVGSQRHLQTVLPTGAAIWSLAVDGQAVQPSLRDTADGRRALLVPLPQQASDDVLVDLVYVTDLTSASWSGTHTLSGPRFDLPLKNITWQVYVPQDFSYGDLGGTMPVDTRVAATDNILRYGWQTYQRQTFEANRRNLRVAQQQQSRARELAQMGEQAAARQALTKGYNFSLGDASLNEDIRVDLDNLVRQQAKVGLVNARDRLRHQSGEVPSSRDPGAGPIDGQGFSQQQAERIASSLGQADNENLELITRRVIQSQTAAEASVSQLQIAMPICGRMLQFASPLQVEPAANMEVAFTAKPRHLAGIDPSLGYAVGLFALLLAAGFVGKWTGRLTIRLHEVLAPAAKPIEPQRPSAPSGPADEDDPPSQVSADELL
ncbi:MAG: hypothetical protein JW993_16450 [Sedimentisphaerales bacterium]|nr:hypothetical protein [Sedimentisphaerales bacterium]